MQHTDTEPQSTHTPTSRRTTVVLVMSAAAILFLSLAATVRIAVPLAEGNDETLSIVGEACVWVAAALATGALFMGLAAVLRLLGELRRALDRLEHVRNGQASGGPPAEALPAETPTRIFPPEATDERAQQANDKSAAPGNTADVPWQEMMLLLQDIRDNSLLSEEERREKKLHLAESEIQNAQEMVRSLLGEKKFARARELAERISRKHPGDPRPEALLEEIEQARQRHEIGDVSASTKRVDDLINISAWDRAREQAQQLQRRHPDSAKARALLLRIEREFQVFQDEQRRRMHAEVQRYVSRRRWKEALAAARTFIERFPGSPEADGLRLEVETLKTNAEIEARQALEEKIMAFAKSGRYSEASELARKVIDAYPGSPQAAALRKQLPRLEELASNPDAPPARIRLD